MSGTRDSETNATACQIWNGRFGTVPGLEELEGPRIRNAHIASRTTIVDEAAAGYQLTTLCQYGTAQKCPAYECALRTTFKNKPIGTSAPLNAIHTGQSTLRRAAVRASSPAASGASARTA